MPVTVQDLQTVVTDKGEVAVTIIRETTAGFVKETTEQKVLTFKPHNKPESLLLGEFEPGDDVDEIINEFIYNQLKPIWIFRRGAK
jgi:hypothetical protein|tara:strand:+ start:305 stop:562 length:258 start_codon:yes stop_codon:yes gene_type:complete